MSRRSFFIYATLLAGMLGAYISEISRLGEVREGVEPGDFFVRFVAALFLGGSTSVLIGVLLPLVVLDKFEGPGINSWTLVAAGGIAGHFASGVLSRADSAVARLLASFESRFDKTTISESVRTGITEALSVPAPTNYEGFFAADVTRFDESVVRRSEEGTAMAWLKHGEAYNLRVQFSADRSLFEWANRGVAKALTIRQGNDEPKTVAFRLFVDFGLVDVPPVERVVTVPRKGAAAVETFSFSVPAHTITSTERSGPSVSKYRPEMSVSVYQQGRYFDSLVLAIALDGLVPSATKTL